MPYICIDQRVAKSVTELNPMGKGSNPDII